MFQHKTINATFVFFALLIVTNSTAEPFNKSAGKVYIEAIAESDEVSELYGFHLITYLHARPGHLSNYFGGGLVFTELPERNDSFLALHAVAGLDYMLTRNLGLNLEFGFDLGEQIISGEDEKGTPTVGGDESNEIDFNFAAGVVINLDKRFYIKTYVRQHFFDGIFLPDTRVTFLGVRAGIAF